jgi:hypothetical protein
MVEYQLPKLGVAGSSPVARFFYRCRKDSFLLSSLSGENQKD